MQSPSQPNSDVRTRHSHYHKPVHGLQYVDVYRVLQLFAVSDPCIQHAVKKLLVAGGRGAGKDISRDVQEAIDSLRRWQEMRAEDSASTETVQSIVQELTPTPGVQGCAACKGQPCTRTDACVRAQPPLAAPTGTRRG